MWQGPRFHLRWGDWFKPDADDQKKVVELVGSALKTGAITQRIAVEKLAPIFGIENIDAVLEELEEEQAKQDERELQKTEAEQKTMHDLARAMNGDGAKPGSGATRGGNTPPNARSGSGGPAAAPKNGKRPDSGRPSR